MKDDSMKPVKLVEMGEKNIEDIADHIVKISDASAKMLGAGLTMKALIILLHEETKVSKRDIEKVLNALPKLRELVFKK